MFSPLDILYIVLAFSILWLTAAIFWLVWQVAMVIKNLNDAIQLAQETMGKIEEALTGMRKKFEHSSSALGAVLHTATTAADFIMEKKAKAKAKKTVKAKVKTKKK
ncbi:hypothetical protein HOI18_04255 [Candidatus Uhrbacteria bacterium]|mgnify:CR=1 FL=1|jgi:hypothetical protein|nr:hypothetical protein [Candidatus Uhrbacteria bacterium]